MRILQKKSLVRVIAMLMSLWIITGCTAGTDKTEPKPEAPAPAPVAAKRVIKHEAGETEITGTPKRIVALEFSFVDALATLGVAPVGIADDNDPKLIIKPIKDRVGQYTSVGSRYQTNLELISSIQPDLIIADLSRHKAIYADLSKIAPTVVLTSLGANYQQTLSAFKVIGEAVGKADEADKILAAHKTKMAELKKAAPGPDRTVLPAVVNSNGFFGHSSSAYAGSLLEELGYKDAVQSQEAYPKLTLEQVVTADPDVLFLMRVGETTVVDEWQKTELWKGITAVKNGAVYYVDRPTWALFRGIIAAETITDEAMTYLKK